MERAWIAAAGNRKGWLISLGLWAVVILAYIGIQSYHRPGRTYVRLDPQLAEVIRVGMPLQPITGGMSEPGDAADDYYQAVLECIASDSYKTLLPGSKLRSLSSPEQVTLRGPDYVLAGAKKKEMQYTSRHMQALDWTGRRFPHYKAFELIGRYCVVKAQLHAKAGQPEQAEELLAAVMILGHQIEQERVRVQGMLTGMGLQTQAGTALLQLYKDTGQEDKVPAVQEYLKALRTVQAQVDLKARETVARLDRDTPPAAELIWLVENDKDRMWRIEAALVLGLTKWTAHGSGDRDASRGALQELQQDPDPLVREAATAGLSIGPEDLRKVR